ncbi:MAG: PD-(D/E)XK nuclease family transposase [Candidatus Riflebacteria bacterium]|nr:PD-(D/E)XK nuclease family transposase [Candidatus Riflebacteria bacterium]
MYFLNYSNITSSKYFVLKEESVKYKANDRYKDNLFRFIFGREENKQNLLDLYNALNNSNYRNKDELEINTLDNVIYMRMKNDVSFVLDNQMVLLEHQSKYNPNMPLRGFLYFAKLYETRLATEMNLKNIYYPKLIKIPTPQYIVLYNGTDRKIGESITLKLSDAFEDDDKPEGYEWTAKMININLGKNKELLLKCKILGEYSSFVDCVRKYSRINNDFTIAIDKAVNECIKKGILKDLLIKYSVEVKNMLLTEFDEEKDWAIIAKGFEEIGYEKGIEKGRKEGKEEGKKEGMKEGMKNIINIMLSNGTSKETILKQMNISNEEYDNLIN